MFLSRTLKVFGVAASLAFFAGCASNESSDAMDDSQNQQVQKSAEEMAAEERQAAIAAAQEELATFGDTIFFDFDDANIKGESVETLKSWANYLKVSGASAKIQGHTDERGSREYNVSLGEARAKAVIGYLVSEGVSSSQLEAVSYGEESPAVDGSNDYAWSRNRRAVLEM